MSFSNEFERLKKLRKAGLITEIEFQQSKQRLLEECVSRIEAFHEHKPTEFALGAETVKVAEEPVERPVPNPAAGKIRIPIRSDRGSHDISVKVQIREEDFRSAPRAEVVNDRVLPEQLPAPRAEVVNDRQLSEEFPALRDEVVNDRHLEELNDRLLEDCVRRIETFYDRNPTYRERWGLPRVKLVRGVVRSVHLSPREETGDYAASLDIDGRQTEISSSSAVRIAGGDRVTLGGYERDGKLVILGYRNESDGSHSDLSNLRTRYRLLLAVGRVSLFAGLIAIAGTLMLFIHIPPAVSNIASWRFAPYVLSGLAAAACYLGLTFSFLGSWAKEFHDAMTPRRLPGLAA